jgi:hypothetical protein
MSPPLRLLMDLDPPGAREAGRLREPAAFPVRFEGFLNAEPLFRGQIARACHAPAVRNYSRVDAGHRELCALGDYEGPVLVPVAPKNR